jgi:outer membrane biosynthesis protein TonB
MTVSLADVVADQAVSPKPDAQAAPDLAPDLGEHDQADQPAPPTPKVVATPEPKPVPKPEPKPEPRPVPKPAPKPEPKPVAKAKVEAKPKPEPKTEAKPKSEPKAKPAPQAKADSKPAGGDTHAKPNPAKPTGGSKIDTNFLAGIPASTTPGTDKVSPGEKPAPISTASLKAAISRQIKPHWKAPQGLDIDKLSVTLSWTLKTDGTLASMPYVVGAPSGIDDSNRAQVSVFVEHAINAVIKVRQFDLPSQVYSQYGEFRFTFDHKLSQ